QYFSHLDDNEKIHRICVVDHLDENISSLKHAGFQAIQIISQQEEQSHQEVLDFARTVMQNEVAVLENEEYFYSRSKRFG
ncbi:MAG: hypothetical protein JO131_05505, partial [Gammaproteobacteria bacterium]|nr:hypothetical protein [Gammaproteobacteria bacterium]